MSSDGRRAARRARVAAEAAARAGAVTGSENGAADGAAPDPWFDPGPKVPGGTDSDGPGGSEDTPGPAGTAGAAEPSTAADSEEAAAEPATGAEWFLPTGRAALMPESMTISTDEDQPDVPAAGYPAQIQAAGAPPWASEATEPDAGAPPWETGPWPGPGASRASVSEDGLEPDSSASDSPAQGGRTGQPSAAPPFADQALSTPPASGPWSPGTVLAAGLVPLVIPGLVAGLVSLRRSKAGDPVRSASILAITASLAWAAIIVVVVVATSGGSAPSCQYPAAVHQAYTRAIDDLSSHAEASVTVADLGQAATRANTSAAATATGDITVRSALFALTADLQQARADVVAKRPVPSSLRARLAADETALTASCPS